MIWTNAKAAVDQAEAAGSTATTNMTNASVHATLPCVKINNPKLQVLMKYIFISGINTWIWKFLFSKKSWFYNSIMTNRELYRQMVQTACNLRNHYPHRMLL